jgi:hypothetical protein
MRRVGKQELCEVMFCWKSQDTGGSRKMVKSRGKDAGMVVGRHEVEKVVV